MPVCALVDTTEGKVISMIMAVASDPVAEHLLLIESPPEWVNVGIAWNGSDFVKPVKPVRGPIDRMELI